MGGQPFLEAAQRHEELLAQFFLDLLDKTLEAAAVELDQFPLGRHPAVQVHRASLLLRSFINESTYFSQRKAY
jgi:hypothetical protein